jgi:hypothetical protein
MNEAKTWSYKTDNAAMARLEELAFAFNPAIKDAADSGLAASMTSNFGYNYDNDIALGAAVLKAFAAVDVAVKNAKAAGLSVDVQLSGGAGVIAVTIQRVTKLWPRTGDAR